MRKYFTRLYWHKIYIKVVKNDGTPEALALGLALGVFAGFFVPTGGQIVVAVALAFFFKANKLLSVMGTMITNPYTGPIFIPIECWIGAIIIGKPLSFHTIKAKFSAFMDTPTWIGIMELGGDFLIPLLIGGVVFSIIFSIPTYYLTLWLVRAHRRRKAAKLLQRQASFAAISETRRKKMEDTAS